MIAISSSALSTRSVGSSPLRTAPLQIFRQYCAKVGGSSEPGSARYVSFMASLLRTATIYSRSCAPSPVPAVAVVVNWHSPSSPVPAVFPDAVPLRPGVGTTLPVVVLLATTVVQPLVYISAIPTGIAAVLVTKKRVLCLRVLVD